MGMRPAPESQDSGSALGLRGQARLLRGTPLLQFILLSSLPFARFAQMAEGASQTILASFRVKEGAWPATSLTMRGRADAGQLR